MRFASLLLIALTACSSDLSAGLANYDSACPGNDVTTLFEVEPAVVVRDAEVDITVRWLTTAELVEPLATFQVGDDPVVEIEVPLVAESAATDHRGSLLNPFGTGAPAGIVQVLAEAKPAAGCLVSPTASTAFTLE
jgi:hypothetical protein